MGGVSVDELEQIFLSELCNMRLQIAYQRFLKERTAELVKRVRQAGYTDMLMQYAPKGYSYVYYSEAGYLDRVFASPTMSTQVTEVQPYHLNADYFYSRGFKRGLDETIFRYADHDPILIHVKLGK